MTAVCDAIYRAGRVERVLPSYIRPLFPEPAHRGDRPHCARASDSTSACPWAEGVERIQSYLRMFDGIQPDDVLVSVNRDSPVGHFGELTGNAAQVHGCVGVILDGNLRDTDGLRDIGLQVFYRDLSPLNAIGRWEMAATQVSVTIGDVEIHPWRRDPRRLRRDPGDPGRRGGPRCCWTPRRSWPARTSCGRTCGSGLSPAEGLEKHGYI